MAVIIADSGSTKTHWFFLEADGTKKEVVTPGINPFFQSEQEIASLLQERLLPQLPHEAVSDVYFYGAGCALPEKVAVLSSALQACFGSQTRSHVESDLLAACRAMCGREAGMVAILGTGSNSALFDGERMVHNVSPLGYVLGDEGSGAVLGRLLLGDLLKNQLPSELALDFAATYPDTPTQMLECVYRRPFPNRYLASFAPFLHKHLAHPHIYQLVYGSFVAFMERNIQQYPVNSYPLHAVGSVACYFSSVLQQAAQGCGVQMGEVIASPIHRLVTYHTAYEPAR